MRENTSAANEERARAYLRAIENRASEEELAAFFASGVVLEQFPNRLVPKLVQSTLADMVRESARGKKSVSKQTYEVQNAVASGDWVALQVKWEGVLSMPVAGLKPAQPCGPGLRCSCSSARGRSCTRAITTALNHGEASMGLWSC